MVTPRRLQHVGHQFGRDRRSALVFLVLPGVGEVGDDRGNAAGGGGPACIDHNQEFHKAVVDVVRARGLEYEDVFIPDGLADCDACFLIRVLKDHDLSELDAQPVCPTIRR